VARFRKQMYDQTYSIFTAITSLMQLFLVLIKSSYKVLFSIVCSQNSLKRQTLYSSDIIMLWLIPSQAT